MYRLFIYDS